MALPRKSFKLKKLPYYLLLLTLTIGASLILGFLSFGGMYALAPILPLAFTVFGLSVAYEGEIYLQNIKGALNKLLKIHYHRNYLAKEFLLEHFPRNLEAHTTPQFFKDYYNLSLSLSAFGHKELDEKSSQSKYEVEKNLSDMEKWFAKIAFPVDSENTVEMEESEYKKQLRQWLSQQEMEKWNKRLAQKIFYFRLAFAFSATAAAFMGLGSTYLLVEAFSAIPLFAVIPFGFWPAFIVPMAIMAGIAYGFLTYNAVTDLVNNNTLLKWYYRIRNDLSTDISVKNVLIAAFAITLTVLAIALTVCTAGTWWTVATKARPLFSWMTKMPPFIMGVLNPAVTGLSAIFFNIQNTAESLDLIIGEKEEHKEKKSSNLTFFKQVEKKSLKIWNSIFKAWNKLKEKENYWQIFNPFRLLIKLTITPLRILLFLGHLLSIALTSDRMPGVPQIVSVLIAIICEGFEDAHYFVGHSHAHHHGEFDISKQIKERIEADSGHNHDLDIPTQILLFLASPLYAAAALWDYTASRQNTGTPDSHTPQKLSFTEAWNKQRGNPKVKHIEVEQQNRNGSDAWKIEQTVYRIEKHQEKHLQGAIIGKDIATQKINTLNTLKATIKENGAEKIKDTLESYQNNEVLGSHRFLSFFGEPKSLAMIHKEYNRVTSNCV